jgi:hypothetical protein
MSGVVRLIMSNRTVSQAVLDPGWEHDKERGRHLGHHDSAHGRDHASFGAGPTGATTRAVTQRRLSRSANSEPLMTRLPRELVEHWKRHMALMVVNGRWRRS